MRKYLSCINIHACTICGYNIYNWVYYRFIYSTVYSLYMYIYIYIYPFHDGQNVLTPLTPPNVVDVTNVETGCFCTSSVRSRGEMTNDSSKVLVVVAKDVVLVALVATMPAIQDIIRYPSEMV